MQKSTSVVDKGWNCAKVPLILCLGIIHIGRRCMMAGNYNSIEEKEERFFGDRLRKVIQ